MTTMVGGAGTGVGCCCLSAGSGGGGGVGGGVGMSGGVNISNYGVSSMKLFGIVENYKILQSKYDGSWRKMWLLRPRLRTDGKNNHLLLHNFISCSSD